ncbi:MAG TPA: hypothetical protein VHR66_18855, partial [Gemmataceae bacterium]|nr:hypothetical protein [Gemmataceae bacterium]
MNDWAIWSVSRFVFVVWQWAAPNLLLQQTPAAILARESSLSLSAAGAAERGVRRGKGQQMFGWFRKKPHAPQVSSNYCPAARDELGTIHADADKTRREWPAQDNEPVPKELVEAVNLVRGAIGDSTPLKKHGFEVANQELKPASGVFDERCILTLESRTKRAIEITIGSVSDNDGYLTVLLTNKDTDASFFLSHWLKWRGVDRHSSDFIFRNFHGTTLNDRLSEVDPNSWTTFEVRKSCPGGHLWSRVWRHRFKGVNHGPQEEDGAERR